jgi:membrane associated rhomboid family serine protease
MSDLNAPPLNPLPPIVWIVALPLIAMEVVLSAGQYGVAGGPEAIGWRNIAIQNLAFSPELLRYFWQTGRYPLDGMYRLISYPLVHGNLTHTLFVIVIFAALGKMVGEVFRWWAFALVLVAATIAGALAYTLVPDLKAGLIGGYPPVYGLIGCFTYLTWKRLAASGQNSFYAFRMISFLLGIQLVFGAVFGGSWEWVADLAGFATGFLLSFVLSPGGWSRLRARIRQR